MFDEKKIFIDEDWKSQVQAEKAAAAAHGSPTLPSEPSLTGSSAPPSDTAETSTDENDPKMPAASFELLVTTLATEALAALGQFPHPVTGKTIVQRNHAQYLIDTLEVLREKTKGNLSSDEQQLIESVLHQMRMLFVTVANRPVL